METPEEFAQTVIQAFEDDHLLSREALPVFIASELKARDNAVRLALLDELEFQSTSWVPYPMREWIWKLRLKYTPPRGKL